MWTVYLSPMFQGSRLAWPLWPYYDHVTKNITLLAARINSEPLTVKPGRRVRDVCNCPGQEHTLIDVAYMEYSGA